MKRSIADRIAMVHIPSLGEAPMVDVQNVNVPLWTHRVHQFLVENDPDPELALMHMEGADVLVLQDTHTNQILYVAADEHGPVTRKRMTMDQRLALMLWVAHMRSVHRHDSRYVLIPED